MLKLFDHVSWENCCLYLFIKLDIYGTGAYLPPLILFLDCNAFPDLLEKLELFYLVDLCNQTYL